MWVPPGFAHLQALVALHEEALRGVEVLLRGALALVQVVRVPGRLHVELRKLSARVHDLRAHAGHTRQRVSAGTAAALRLDSTDWDALPLPGSRESHTAGGTPVPFRIDLETV